MKTIAIIGSGRMGKIYSDAAKASGLKVCGVVGNSKEKTDLLAKDSGSKSYPEGRLDLLLGDFPHLDGVILATPEWVRLDPLKKLVVTDIKILIEKPLVSSKKDLLELESVIQGKNENVSVVHSQRFNPKFITGKKMIDEGRLGQIRHIYARRNPNLLAVQRVLGKFSLAYWLTCHDFDIMRWFTGDELEWVSATSRNKMKSADDYIMALLHFKSGIDAFLEVSWCSELIADSAPMATFVVKGTKGLLEIDDTMNNVKFFGQDHVVETLPFEGVEQMGHKIFTDLVSAWATNPKGKIFHPSYDDGKKAVMACALIEESIGSGKKAYGD